MEQKGKRTDILSLEIEQYEQEVATFDRRIKMILDKRNRVNEELQKLKHAQVILDKKPPSDHMMDAHRHILNMGINPEILGYPLFDLFKEKSKEEAVTLDQIFDAHLDGLKKRHMSDFFGWPFDLFKTKSEESPLPAFKNPPPPPGKGAETSEPGPTPVKPAGESSPDTNNLSKAASKRFPEDKRMHVYLVSFLNRY